MPANITPSDAELLSLREFCDQYSIRRTSAYSELKTGRLRARKFGSRTLIEKSEAERWKRALPDYEPRGGSAAPEDQFAAPIKKRDCED